MLQLTIRSWCCKLWLLWEVVPLHMWDSDWTENSAWRDKYPVHVQVQQSHDTVTKFTKQTKMPSVHMNTPLTMPGQISQSDAATYQTPMHQSPAKMEAMPANSTMLGPVPNFPAPAYPASQQSAFLPQPQNPINPAPSQKHHVYGATLYATNLSLPSTIQTSTSVNPGNIPASHHTQPNDITVLPVSPNDKPTWYTDPSRCYYRE